MSAAPPVVHASQVGWMCASRKRVVVAAEAAGGDLEFAIQDLGRIESQSLGSSESWAPAFRGRLAAHRGPMGAWLVGDFSALRRPGVYRAALGPAGERGWSFPFVVSDSVWSRLPLEFLDYVHAQRCGGFEDETRGPCHLDDGVRSDNGAAVDAAGGWHDAGDLRKWMSTTPLPVLGFFDLRTRLGLSRNHWRERPHEDDLLAEAAWGLRWVLKMQDPGTGMFFEDVGGGGEARREPGMSWWYENHSGCLADNAGNRFTDNRPASGDERTVRVQYNPVAQYVAICVLMDAADHFHAHYPAFSQLCRQASLRCWDFMRSRRRDDYHGWSSVVAWRLLAALRLHTVGASAEAELAALVSVLLDLQSPAGWWYMDRGRLEPYRGIVNAAQPVIALSSFLEADYDHPLAGAARAALERCWGDFVLPMLQTNPFGIMPYGLFSRPVSEGEVYHPWKDGLALRFFMPTRTPQQVNHGLSSHWTSWAHALALLGAVLERDDCRDAAFDQLAWVTGCNPLNACMISGVGCRPASPYSRFYGTIPGGFCVGPRGTPEDEVEADLEGRTQWSSGEYWLVPLANAAMALAALLPSRVMSSRKLGQQEPYAG